MKKEFYEAIFLIGVMGFAIYLASKKDTVLNSAKSNAPNPTGPKGGFENFTADDLSYDDNLYNNASGEFKGLKIK